MKFVALGEVTRVVAGQAAPPKGVFNDSGYPFIRAGSLEALERARLWESLEYLDTKTAERHKLKLIPANTVLFAKSGMSAMKGRIFRTDRPAYIVSHLAGLIPTGKYDPNYLTHWLKSWKTSQLIRDSSYPSIRLSDIANVAVPALSLSEQKRIAAILDQADTLRTKRNAAIHRLNDLCQSIFYEMFGDLRRNEKNFNVLPFGEIAEIKLGKMLDKGKFKGERKRKYIRNANVRWFNFDLTDLFEMEFAEKELKRFSVKPGDLMICEGGEPGRCAVWNEPITDIYYQKALHRARPNTDLVLPEYLAHWLYVATSNGMISDSVTSATIAHLTGQKIKKLQIAIPPIDSQHKFLDKIGRFENAHSAMAKQQSLLDQNFISLQQRAFKGEL